MTFRSSGKLLITGEYLVLKGAKALALPTNLGQEMTVSYYEATSEPTLFWKAYNAKKSIWLESSFKLPSLELIKTTENSVNSDLNKLLSICFNQNPGLFKSNHSIKIETHLEFPNDWGLGSSSTLIANLSKWSNVDAFTLLKSVSKGSGYDVAVAIENTPIIYHLESGTPNWKAVDFKPKFSDKIYFIHLNKKQKSETEIDRFFTKTEIEEESINTINTLSYDLLKELNLSEFESIIKTNENTISNHLSANKIKDILFTDYHNGVVKSLGAWGGDFILVTVNDNTDLEYFKKKGYNTILSYNEMILQ